MQIFLLILQILPAIFEVIKSLEKLTDGIPNIGPEKSAAILDAAKGAYDIAKDLNGKTSWDKIAGAIQNAITVFVKFANAVGLFKKSTTPTPPSA